MLLLIFTEYGCLASYIQTRLILLIDMAYSLLRLSCYNIMISLPIFTIND